MVIPSWFKAKYGNDKVCSGWYAKIEKGSYELMPYNVHVETKDEKDKDYVEGSAKAKESLKEQITKQTSNIVSELIGKEPRS